MRRQARWKGALAPVGLWACALPTVHRFEGAVVEAGRTSVKGVGGIGRAPDVDRRQLALAATSGSSQVAPRHPKAVAYRCFLPDLTGFTDPRCVGPDSQRRSMSWEAKAGRPRPGIQSRCSGLRVQGTASSPPSTTGRDGRPGQVVGQRGGGGEGGIRTHVGLPRTAFPVPRPRPLGDLSRGADRGWRRGWDSNPRWVAPHRFSRAAPSTTRTPLRAPPSLPQAFV